MQSMSSLLDPRRSRSSAHRRARSRGTSVMQTCASGFKGEIYAVNPRYQEVLGYKCVASVADLPERWIASWSRSAPTPPAMCWKQAYAHGHSRCRGSGRRFRRRRPRRRRARRGCGACRQGHGICGPNCFGIISVKAAPRRSAAGCRSRCGPGRSRWCRRAAGSATIAFSPLMSDRKLGFGYFVSCGNQIGATIEDYVETFRRRSRHQRHRQRRSRP